MCSVAAQGCRGACDMRLVPTNQDVCCHQRTNRHSLMVFKSCQFWKGRAIRLRTKSLSVKGAGRLDTHMAKLTSWAPLHQKALLAQGPWQVGKLLHYLLTAAALSLLLRGLEHTGCPCELLCKQRKDSPDHRHTLFSRMIFNFILFCRLNVLLVK
jgi:hypothetical protein